MKDKDKFKDSETHKYNHHTKKWETKPGIADMIRNTTIPATLNYKQGIIYGEGFINDNQIPFDV